MLENSFLRRLIIVGTGTKHSHSLFQGKGLQIVYQLACIISAYTHYHRLSASHFFVGKLDDGNFFLPAECGRFAGSAKGYDIIYIAMYNIIEAQAAPCAVAIAIIATKKKLPVNAE